MAIGFNSIPLDLRTPGVFVEFDASRASRGLPVVPHTVLLFGQKLAAGAAATGVPLPIRTRDEAVAAFGRGSMLERMFKAFKANDALSSTYAIALPDAGGAVAATKTVTITGPATAAGALALQIAGQRKVVAVANEATATQVAALIVAAVTAAPDLPVTAANVAGVVTLTARHPGAAGSGIDVRLGDQISDAVPAGLTVAFAAGVAGAANPDISAVFTAIGDMAFSAFVCPYSDADNLEVLEGALLTRWGPMKAIDGLGYAAASGNYAALAALGAARNSPFDTIIGARGLPSPMWEFAAAYGAQVGFAGAVDPARPFQTLPLIGIVPPSITDQFTQSERDALLRDGISTFTVQGGVCVIERAITTYQVNGLGVADTAWLDVNTPLTLSALRYTLRSRISSKYSRHKLVSDTTVIPAGQAMTNPKGLRSEVIAWYQDCIGLGWVEDLETFKAQLVLERDVTDPNRVNALIPPDLVNQLRVFAAVTQFAL